MKASIVIPTRNRPDKLRECLTSVFTATSLGPHTYEVIVVDDHSDFSTHAALGDEFPGVRWLWTSERRSTSGAANMGLEVATGDVAFVVGDDWILPLEFLLAYVSVFIRHPDVGCIGGVMRPRQQTIWTRLEDWSARLAGQWPPREFVIGGREVPGGCAWRMAAIRPLGFYDTKLQTGEDFEMRDRVVAAGWRVANVPYVTIIHNDTFGWDYAVRRIWRRGLDTMPPDRWPTARLLPRLPELCWKTVRKTFNYRRRR